MPIKDSKQVGISNIKIIDIAKIKTDVPGADDVMGTGIKEVSWQDAVKDEAKQEEGEW